MIFGKKPEKVDPVTQKGLDQLDKTQESMKDFNKDKIDQEAPEPIQTDPQIKWSKIQLDQYDAPVIKPTRSFAPRSKPNPKEAKKREMGWELVKCIVENLEVIGEAPKFWLDCFQGDPTYFWEIPANIPVYIPRFVAEHLSKRHYHIFKMRDTSDMNSIQSGTEMTVRETRKRLDCRLAGFGL